jgi:hypothetical protein
MVRDDEVKDHDEMVRDFVAMSGASVEVVRRYITYYPTDYAVHMLTNVG